MKPATLSILACPSCRTGYELTPLAVENQEVISGLLTCPTCAVVTPIVRGFPLFTEPLLQASDAALAALDSQLFGSAADYDLYRARKLERGGMEIYAAFQPFNEASRAVEPLLAGFARALQPGDYILDPWCRTGWSAEWLAALFPEQTVVALWEGETSVLGYRGFDHWLGAGRRSPNVEVMFVAPDRSLPFASGAFAGVYSQDAFHRFRLIPFAGELLRVASPSAALVLAHLHLSNSEPEPFFERGGFKRHGADYAAWLDRLAARSGRRGRVFSETDLFEAAEGAPPAADPATAHYNGLVLIEPKDPPAFTEQRSPPRETRYLMSPLYRLHFSRRMARVDGALHDGAVDHLLERHPVYRARLPKGPIALTELQLVLLAFGVCGRTAEEMAGSLGLPDAALCAPLAGLAAAELLRPSVMTAPGVALHRFHANQLPPPGNRSALRALLEALAAPGEAVLRTSDGGSLAAEEVEIGLRAFAAYLRAAGLAPGRRLAVEDARHPLALLLVVAGLALGLQVELGDAPGADLTVGQSGGPGRIAFGLDGAPGDTLLAWVADHVDAPPVELIAGGRLRLPVDGRRLWLDAEVLAEAALSFGAAAEVQSTPVESFADVAGWLACLTHIGSGRGLTLRG